MTTLSYDESESKPYDDIVISFWDRSVLYHSQLVIPDSVYLTVRKLKVTEILEEILSYNS